MRPMINPSGARKLVVRLNPEEFWRRIFISMPRMITQRDECTPKLAFATFSPFAVKGARPISASLYISPKWGLARRRG